MRKICKNFLIAMGGLAVIVTALPVVACNKQTANKLVISGGTDKIYIDQSSGDSISGWYLINFNVTYKNKQLNNESLIWTISDCESNKIYTNGEYVVWDNPEQKNIFFRLKATYFDDETKTYIEGVSDKIEFVGDSSIFKIEFSNSDIGAHQIIAEKNTVGLQQTPWVLKINGEPYEGLHEHFTLMDANGNIPSGISFNQKNQIVWDNSLTSGTEYFYIKTTIVDPNEKRSYDIISTNNPIKFIINQPKLTIDGDAKSRYVPARKDGLFSSFRLKNQKNIDITSSPTTYWNLQNTGEIEFGNNIFIVDGQVSYSKELKPGSYSFKIKANDAESGFETESDDITLICYETLTVKGGQTNINVWLGEKGYDANPWILSSGEIALTAEKFEIVPVSPDEQPKIDTLKEHVKLSTTPSNEGVDKVFLTWDSNVPFDKYKFKIQATYNGSTILSNQINFNVYDKTSKFIYFNHNISKITAVKSQQNKSNLNDTVPPSRGKCYFPIDVYFCTGQKMKTSDLKFSFSGIDGVKFAIDEDGYLSWEGLNEIDDSKIEPINYLTIKATYQYGSFELTANTTIEFCIDKLYDENIFKLTDDSYSFRSNLGGYALKPIYFPDQLGQQHYMSKDGIDSPFAKNILIRSNNSLVKLKGFQSKHKSYYETRHFIKIEFDPLVPARSKAEYVIAPSSPSQPHHIYLHSNWHPVSVAMSGEYNFFWWSNPEDAPKYLPWYTGHCIPFEAKRHQYKDSDPFDFDCLLSATVTNDSYEARRIPIYIGIGISLAQGDKFWGPDLGTSFEGDFAIRDVEIKEI